MNLDEAILTANGDNPGHPFRGNQYRGDAAYTAAAADQLDGEKKYADGVSDRIKSGSQNVPGESVRAQHAYASRLHDQVSRKAERLGLTDLAKFHKEQSDYHMTEFKKPSAGDLSSKARAMDPYFVNTQGSHQASEIGRAHV